MNEAVAEIHARVAAIQARFATAAPRRVAEAGATGPSTRSASAFEAALARAGSSSASGGVGPFRPVTGDGTPVSGDRVVAAASRYLGVPYRWGGTDPDTGLDCSGFVQRVYRDLGVELPRVSRDQARVGQPVAGLAEARPGDLLAFDASGARPGIDHIGIYVGDGKMVVAPRTGDVVKIQEVSRPPSAIRRVLPGGSAAAGAGSAPAGSAPAAAGAGRVPYAELFEAAGARHGVAPALLAAVARAESSFDPGALSPAGAQGLMQLMPATARSLGVDPFDPPQAVDGAARLLAGHVQRFGSTELALAAYNAGAGAVTRHGGVPPYPETRAYVRRITSELQGATP